MECELPLFRSKFFGSLCWGNGATVHTSPGKPSTSDTVHNTSANVEVAVPNLRNHKENLRSLDLKALPRDDGPQSESQARRLKFQYFEKRCSEVATGLFLGSDHVAKNRELLREHGVTHVVNCVGFLYPEYFKDELCYKTLYLQGMLQIHHQQHLLRARCRWVGTVGTTLKAWLLRMPREVLIAYLKQTSLNSAYQGLKGAM
jgi:hypothetical protein